MLIYKCTTLFSFRLDVAVSSFFFSVFLSSDCYVFVDIEQISFLNFFLYFIDECIQAQVMTTKLIYYSLSIDN